MKNYESESDSFQLFYFNFFNFLKEIINSLIEIIFINFSRVL